MVPETVMNSNEGLINPIWPNSSLKGDKNMLTQKQVAAFLTFSGHPFLITIGDVCVSLPVQRLCAVVRD